MNQTIVVENASFAKKLSHFFVVIVSKDSKVAYLACQNEKAYQNKSELMQIYANEKRNFEVKEAKDLINKEISFNAKFDSKLNAFVFVRDISIKDKIVVKVDIVAKRQICEKCHKFMSKNKQHICNK
jgi:uncharacterized protein (UPF0333 family)